MSGGYQLMLMIAGIHLLGLGCVAVLMVLAFRQGPSDAEWPSDPGRDDGWGNKPHGPSERGDRPRGGIPLPDAEQAGLRLRDHRKLPELLPRPERRPAREPEPAPEREPVSQ
jgi:hypothetical protein